MRDSLDELTFTTLLVLSMGAGNELYQSCLSTTPRYHKWSSPMHQDLPGRQPSRVAAFIMVSLYTWFANTRNHQRSFHCLGEYVNGLKSPLMLWSTLTYGTVCVFHAYIITNRSR